MTWFHQALGSSLGGNSCSRSEPTPFVAIDCDGYLLMPKFKLDYKAELLPELLAMGMAVGDFPDICSGCFLSEVVQKTHLEVDEKGTTATAATGGAMLAAFAAVARMW